MSSASAGLAFLCTTELTATIIAFGASAAIEALRRNPSARSFDRLGAIAFMLGGKSTVAALHNGHRHVRDQFMGERRLDWT